MSTPYSMVFNIFLSQIQDYDFLDQCIDVTERDMNSYLWRALAGCQNMVLNVTGLDLRLRDDTLQEFEEDLPDEVISLLVTGMENFWISSKAQNTENMRNLGSTRDFTFFSPPNLLFRLRELRTDIEDRWIRERNSFAQRFSDIAGLVDERVRHQKNGF